MASRPAMHARDSSGNNVSLLNEDPTPHQGAIASTLPFRNPSHGSNQAQAYPQIERSSSAMSAQSQQSVPRTPYLQRCDSWDSNTTAGPLSPATPRGLGEFGRQSSFSSSTGFGAEPKQDQRSSSDFSTQSFPRTPSHFSMPSMSSMRPEFPRSQSSGSDQYPEDANGAGPDARPKRYPCRFKERLTCTKTFTTSGHASRHAKIHTSEKSVRCIFSGCHKKFTRADNMKQHLETHNKIGKDRSAAAASRAQNPSTARGTTRPAGVSKSATRPTSSNSSRREHPYQYRGERYSMQEPPSLVYQHHATSRPVAAQPENPSGGLDALAALAAAERESFPLPDLRSPQTNQAWA